MSASAATGGSIGGCSAGTVEVDIGAVGCGVGTGGAPFVVSAFSPFRIDFDFSSLFASAKLFCCFLLGKHMGKNGRGRVDLSGL